MKYILLFLLTLNAQANVIDKNLAESINNTADTYGPLFPFSDPNGGVAFYSDSTDPTLLMLEEVLIDDNDVSDNMIVFTRSNNTPKGITRCESEKGTVAIVGNELRVSTSSLPVRFICYGNGSNYKEVYMTIKKP